MARPGIRTAAALGAALLLVTVATPAVRADSARSAPAAPEGFTARVIALTNAERAAVGVPPVAGIRS